MLRFVWLLALAGMAAGAEDLPPLDRGIAGQLVGTIGEWLVAAGGTWWTAPPAEGGKKIWTDRILVLAPGAREWREAGRLPRGLGYGGAVSLRGALLVLGGQTDSAVVRTAYRLVRKGDGVAVEPLPDLPEPAAFTAAAHAGGRVYLLGGQRANDADRAAASVWSLDDKLKAWRREPDLPAEGRILPAAAACGDTLYLATGAALFRDPSGEVKRRYLKDAWRLRPGIGWQRIPDLPAPAVAAPAVCADGPVLFSGDDGSMVGRVFTPPARHPGFATRALRFDGARWSEAATLPVGLVTTGAAEWNGRIAIVGGEDRPGSRSPRVLAVTLAGAARAALFRIRTDVSQAPEDAPFAERAKAVCEEWYPKVNAILFGPGRPLPFPEIEIVFEEMRQPAVTTVTLSSNRPPECQIRIARDQRNRSDDFGGMVIHELTHAVQNYPPKLKNADWVEEGIADYVRHKHFEKDILGKLTLDAQGVLRGYTMAAPFFFGLQEGKVSLERKGYLKAYTVASEFLYWLEQRKNPEIVRRLNASLSKGRYTASLFQEHCGAPLDELWKQFLTNCRR